MSLPDYLTDQTQSTILSNMLNNVPDDIDKTEGSYIWDSLSPVSIELANAALWAQEVLKRGFAETTFGTYLDLRCHEHGIERNPPVQAIGTVTFTGTPGVVIPAGTKVSTESTTTNPAIIFSTTTDTTIGTNGTATANILADVGGIAGNLPTGAIKLMFTPVTGVASVTNPAPTYNGLDEESDADLLARLLTKVRYPGTSGNKNDYMNWALANPNVGGVQVIPLWNGPGTVKVVLVGTDKKPADSNTVQAVQADIGQKAPIGASVTVVPATAVNVNVSATVTLASGTNISDVQNVFNQALDTYLAGVTFSNDLVVRYSRIGMLLLDIQGVLDFSNLTVNNGTANITLLPDESAVRGTVVING
jgi:uncharacterized phage protein gp47/JayE